MTNDNTPQSVPTEEYRWVMRDGHELLQQRWSDGTWRPAPPDAPQPPKVFSVDD